MVGEEESRENTSDLPVVEHTDQENERLDRIARIQEASEKRRAELSEIKVERQVETLADAKSEEVLLYCLKELNQGTTYNELRRKLGLGPAANDHRWRTIRNILGEMILPDSEEEQLKSAHAMSSFMIGKLESFLERVTKRAEILKGADNEAQVLKLEIDTIKMIMDKYDKQTEHYLKMKDLKKKESKTQGNTIVFNNKFYVKRPGDVHDVKPLEKAAELVNRLQTIEDDDD